MMHGQKNIKLKYGMQGLKFSLWSR